MEKIKMLGAVVGDIIGSVYEFRNVKTTDFELFPKGSRFTDDSVMTLAVAKWLTEDKRHTAEGLTACMQELGRRHEDAGYGGRFLGWLWEENPQPYNSWGNGAGMRVSPVGLFAKTLDEALALAEITASVSHNHPEGVKGAQAIATSVFLAKEGKSKQEIKAYVEQAFGYDLDRTTADITTGEVLTLTATVHPEDAGNLNVVWSSSDEAVATVSQDGKVTGVALGRATITVTTVDRGLTATCKVSVRNAAPEPYVTPDPVDIGLSVKWGSFNLGAKEIAGYGYYFAWGETWTKDTYSSDNYWWREDGSIFRYFQLDERTRLVPQDDAVHVNLGGKWRMPTYDEFEELYGTCRNHRDYEWEWKVVNGHAGYEIRYLVNGNSIFLPAAGLREVDTLAGVDTVVALLSADLDPTSYGSSALAMTLEENELYGSVPASSSG